MLSSAVSYNNFTSLEQAFEMIGYCSDMVRKHISLNTHLRDKHPEIITRTMAATADVGGLWRVIPIPICQSMRDCRLRWRIRVDPTHHQADVTLAVRLDPDNPEELDCYLLPWLDLSRLKIQLCNLTSSAFEA